MIGLGLGIGFSSRGGGTARSALKATLDSAGNSGMFYALDPLAGLDGSDMVVPNIAGGLPDLDQASSNAPTLDGTVGLQFPASADKYIDAAASGTFTLMLLMRKASASTNGHVVQDASGNYLYTSGSGVGITATTSVDGATVANRGAFFTALDDGAWHDVRFDSISLSQLRIGRTSAALHGDVVAVVALDESEIADLPATIAQAEAWFAEIEP